VLTLVVIPAIYALVKGRGLPRRGDVAPSRDGAREPLSARLGNALPRAAE